jgi:hypothetical protein
LWRWFDVGLRVVTAFIVPLLIWYLNAISHLTTSVEANTNRLSVIEANRFTSSDALDVWRAIEQRPTREELNTQLTEILRRLDALR